MNDNDSQNDVYIAQCASCGAGIRQGEEITEDSTEDGLDVAAYYHVSCP